MRDISKAIAYAVILGVTISITIPGIPAIFFWGLVSSPIGDCRDMSPTDCAFYMYVGVWALVAITVGLVYLAFQVWNSRWIRSLRG